MFAPMRPELYAEDGTSGESPESYRNRIPGVGAGQNIPAQGGNPAGTANRPKGKVRRANRMLGQDVDAMYEARCAQEWEEINEEPEIPFHLVDSELNYAWGEMSDAYDRLAWACDYAEGHPVYYRIQSLLNDLENLQNEVKKLQKEVKDL